jgi:general secretion pathway protein K
MLKVSSQNGVALVLVLWITVMLMIMAGAFSLTLQREAKLIENLKVKSEASAAAEAGLNYALLMLALKDPEISWKADGSMREVPFNGSVLRIKIGDEGGKIDLNFATRELLVKMFNSVDVESGVADKLADAIIDWRDANDDVHLNGAERKDYVQHHLPYTPRNAPFQSVEELQFVLGVTPKLYKVVEPMLTVYSQKSGVDKTKASPQVLRILQAMAEDSGQSAGAGDASIKNDLGATDGDSADEETDAESDSDSETGSGGSAGKPVSSTGIYTFDIQALLPSGQSGRIRVLAHPVQTAGALYEILSWKYSPGRNTSMLSQDRSKDVSFFHN